MMRFWGVVLSSVVLFLCGFAIGTVLLQHHADAPPKSSPVPQFDTATVGPAFCVYRYTAVSCIPRAPVEVER